MYFAGSANGVHGIIYKMIVEGNGAKFVDKANRRYVVNWSAALDRYIEFREKKNPYFKKKNLTRRQISNRLRSALLNSYKKEGAQEYMDSREPNDNHEIVEREFQMPSRVFESLFEKAELSDESEEQKQEQKRHLSEVS